LADSGDDANWLRTTEQGKRMKETRRTKDWITPEILEKSHQEHQMMAREAINTSDNVGVPLVEAESILSTFVPDAQDILSLKDLFDKRFFKLFFIGIAVSGILTLCTIGSHRYVTADKTDWNSLYSAGRSLTWTRNYDDAGKCFKAALEINYLGNAERSYTYGELARLAERKGELQSAREYRLKETEYSQVAFGLVTILIASIILFAITMSSVFMFSRSREKPARGWHQPLIVTLAAYAISTGIHHVAPSVPFFLLLGISALITFAVLVLSAACDGSGHPHFVTPSRD
jgi:hypothetical protein